MGRLVLGIVLSSVGCGPSPGLDASLECARDGRLEVGAGGSRLRALPPSGGELSIVLGSQGGIHVVVGAWVRDLPLELDLVYRLEDPDGSLVGHETRLEGLRPGLFSPDGDRYQRHPDLVVLDNERPEVAAYAGREVVLRAEARSAGVCVADARSVTLRAP